MGAEKKTRSTLVSRVGAGPAQENQEHGSSALQFFGSGSQEGTQITFKLFFEGIYGALFCTVDEYSSIVVRR